MRREYIYFGIVVAINLILKSIFLDFSPFCFDESISLKDTLLDFGHIKHESEWDNNPPFYYYCLWVWLKLFPTNEFNVRLLGVLFMSLAIGFFYLFTLKNFGRKVALLTVLLLTCSNFLTFYAQEARTYSLVVFLTSISTILFFKFLESRKYSHLLLLSLVNFLIIYSHYIAGMFVFFQYVFLAFYSRKLITKGLLVQTCIILVLIFLRFTKKQFELIFNFGKKDDFWLKKATFSDLISAIGNLYYGPIIAIIFSSVALFFVYRILKEKKLLENKALIYCFLMGFVSLLLLFGIGCFKPIFLSRYLIFVVPFATILVIHELLRLKLSGTLIIALIMISSGIAVNLKKDIYPDYRMIAEVVKKTKRSNDVVIINTRDNINLFWYYFDKTIFLRYKHLDSISNTRHIYGVNNLEEMNEINLSSSSKTYLIQSFHTISGKEDEIGLFMSKRFKKTFKTDFYKGVDFSIFGD